MPFQSTILFTPGEPAASVSSMRFEATSGSASRQRSVAGFWRQSAAVAAEWRVRQTWPYTTIHNTCLLNCFFDVACFCSGAVPVRGRVTQIEKVVSFFTDSLRWEQVLHSKVESSYQCNRPVSGCKFLEKRCGSFRESGFWPYTALNRSLSSVVMGPAACNIFLKIRLSNKTGLPQLIN